MNAPPAPQLLNYPAAVGVGLAIVFTAVLVFVASRFDPTMGTLTIGLLVTVAFIGVVIFMMFFSVSSDEITSSAIGGLTTAFGAVVVFFLSKKGPPA